MNLRGDQIESHDGWNARNGHSLYPANSEMPTCNVLIRDAMVAGGSGSELGLADVALCEDSIREIGLALRYSATQTVEADGLVLAPGFIDVHTHDDIAVIHTPGMLPKLSQG
jgi:N-acyl-D-amino-acid deacylase